MTLEELVKLVHEGKFSHEAGTTVEDGGIQEGFVTMPWDAEKITAECFRIDIFDFEKVTWEEGLAQVQGEMAKYDPPKASQ